MTDENIAQCEACGCVMDVSAMQPFANVECPQCHTHNRVKLNIGNYILSQSQGVGGMSLVFRAQDHTLGREVAIKILNESYSMDAKRIEQFEKEAQITAAISHPHVVRVYTVGQAYKRFYIAMELVPGDSLEQKMINEGALPEKEVLRWGREVCEGLSAANEAGLIHRDIKPGNILLDAEGHVKIVDFGLALVTQGGKAQAEEIWATPYYVPPETLDVAEEDFRSDIYALGASLFHALYGKPPFDTDSRSTTELKQIKMNLPKLSECAPHLSNATCVVIDKAMAFDPDDRYSSYKEFITDLHRAEMLLESGGGEGFEVSSSVKPRAKSNFKIYGLVATGVLLVGGGFAAKFLMSGDDEIVDKEPVEIPLEGISGSNDGGESGERLSSSIKQARGLLKNQEISQAAEEYSKISRDSRFPIDSNMWGGVHSSILHFLDGKPAASKLSIRTLQRLHADKLSKGLVDDPNELTVKLAEVMSDYRKMKSIDADLFSDVNSESRALVGFSAALKNWEEGYFEEALEILSKVGAYSNQGVSEELIFYRSLISNYQDDYELMSPYREAFIPTNDTEIETRRAALKVSKAKVKTKGRVVENFDEWFTQLDIYSNRLAYERSQTAPEVKPVEVVPPKVEVKFDDWDEAYTAIFSQMKLGDFESVKTILVSKKFRSEEENKKKAMLIYLCDQAKGYLKTLNVSFGKEVVKAPIILKSGKKYNAFGDSDEEGVTVKDGSALLKVKWRDITTLSMIDLVKISLGKDSLGQNEKNRRLEQAIAYAYLGGEKPKAATAAEILGKASPKFKARWALCMQILQEK